MILSLLGRPADPTLAKPASTPTALVPSDASLQDIDAASQDDAPSEATTELEATAPADDEPSSGLTPGVWVGSVTGGFQGDRIQFTVLPDRQRIDDVVIEGYWRCKDGASSFSSTKPIDVGHVPDSFCIDRTGNFGEEKHAPYLVWTVSGTFESATQARGTIRIEYATECDTYLLDWTAAPVSQ